MKKTPLIATTLLISMAGSPAFAQNGPETEPPALDQSQVIAAGAALDRPFADPGNEKAKRFAEQMGISVGEATSQMRRNWALNQFLDRLQKRNPDLFSFVGYENGGLVLGLTDPNADIANLLPPGLTGVKRVKARYSHEGTKRKLDELNEQVRRLGLTSFSVSVNSETGKVELRSASDTEKLLEAVRDGTITPEGEYEVIRDQIVPTNYYGGLAWNVDANVCPINGKCEGTTGFSMIQSTGSARYVSTAGHIHNGRARYNTSLTSGYTSGGTTLNNVVDLGPTYRFDVQYATPNSTSNVPNPYFWDGSQYVLVDGWTYPAMGYTFCKFGRKTKKTCGTHGSNTMTSNTFDGVTYSYLYRVNNSDIGSKFIIEGDSGGPVYYGTLAVGWVHGRDSSYNMYYSAYSDFRYLNTGADIIIAY